MSVDPSDDCTFWYTNEYYVTTNAWDWTTRIGSFRFPGCGPTGPAFSIDDVKAQAGGTADFTVTLSPQSAQPASIDYSTQPGSAGGNDYTSTSGTLQFDAGQTTATVSVPVTSSERRDSTFSVVLSNPSGAEIRRIRGTATIAGSGGAGAAPANQPDGMIRGPREGFAGAHVYNTTGRRQTRKANLARGVTRVFVIRVENHGARADRFRIRGPHGTPAVQLQYRMMWSATDITRKVVSGWDILRVPRHSRRAIRLFVTATRRSRLLNPKWTT